MLFAVILTACVFASCSKDDDDNSGAASSLTMNGEAIKVKSIEGEYDPSTSFRAFTFWVNDASVINTGVYIQVRFSARVLHKLRLLLPQGNGYLCTPMVWT